MQLSPAHLIALLRARGIRVEVEELLRLHEALQAGADWTPQRLENVIVGILATCPEDGPRIHEAVRELRHALDPVLAGAATAKPRAPVRRVVGPPPLLSRRLVVGLGLGGVAAAATTVVLLSRQRDLDPPEPEPEPPSRPPSTPTNVSESASESGHANTSGGPELDTTGGNDPTGEPTDSPVPAPPTSEPEPEPEAAWITEERAKQAEYREAQAARRKTESDARIQAIAEIDAARTSRRVSVPRFVPIQTSWHRLVGAALLGPAAATGAIAWFAHRAWRRRMREAQRFGGPALEVAPGPSLFWLTPGDRRWPPLLGVEAREALVWGVGQAASEEPTRVLDADASIDATIDHGGLPELRFRGQRRLRRVWLWHDQSETGPVGARLCAEVQQTLHGHGLAVEVGRFWGLPESLEREDGRLLSLDALDDERETSTVVILTDGVELLRQWEWRDAGRRSRQPQVRALLGRLAAWPHLTVVHTGTRERLRALRALLEPVGIPCVPLEAFPLAVREREHLLQTLGTLASSDNVWMWAALCALYPLPVPEALALALLRHLELPISLLSLAQLMDQSVTTAGIQFKPQARARLIERLRRALDDGSGTLPRPMQQALAFWRARTIEGDADWASDTSGRGLHRRLVVALLDLWTDPERAAEELSALWKSPHMPAIREELGRMRPGKKPGAPEPGSFHVPIDPEKLSPTARARLQAAGLPGLAAPARTSRARWPWWLRGLVGLTVLLFVAGVVLLAVDLLRVRTPAMDDSARWALASPADPAAGDRLLAHVAGEWRDVGTWPIGDDVELVTETVEVPCTAEGGLRRCVANAVDDIPARRIAVLDAARDSVDAVRFADSLLDRGLVDAAWIGAWPPWMTERAVRAIEGRRGLEVWVFSIDPEFVPPGAEDKVRALSYPSILGGSTGRVVAADFCGEAVCAVTEAGNVVRVLRGDRAGNVITELRGHRDRVTAAAWSPDGTRIVTVSDDYTARVWNVNEGGASVLLQTPADKIMSAAGWSPDGKRIVTASGYKTARVWNADGTGEPVLLTGHADKVLAAAWSPDGKHIVTGSADKTARVWNADETGKPIVLAGHAEAVQAAAWSADGKRIVTASADRAARIWNADGTGEPVVITGSDAALTSVAWSLDGQRILAGSVDNTARVWDAAKGTELAVLRHGVGPGLTAVAFSPDGTHLLTASEAGTVRVWTADGRPVSKRVEDSETALEHWRDWKDAPSSRTLIHRSNDWAHLLTSFSADEAALPDADGQEVRLAVVPQDPQALLVWGVPGPVTAATGTLDGGLLVGTGSGEVYRWSAAGGAVVAGKYGSSSVAFVSGADKRLSLASNGTVQEWDGDGISRRRDLTVSAVALGVVTLDGAGLVLATRTGQVVTIDDHDRVPLSLEEQSWNGAVDGLASWSSDHIALLSGDALHVCAKKDGWTCREHTLEFVPQMLAASPSSLDLAVASKAHAPVLGVLPVLGGDGVRSRLQGPIGWPVALRYSPDGTRLAVASLDGTVRLANPGSEDCPLILRHETPLADIAFSADSSLIATASFDGDVRVFRATDGAGPVRLEGHRGPVCSVAFVGGQGDPRIVSVSDDGSARVWTVPAAEAFAGAEQAESRCDPRPDCPEGQVDKGNGCVSGCPEGQVDKRGVCVSVCAKGQIYKDGRCLSVCLEGKVYKGGACVWTEEALLADLEAFKGGRINGALISSMNIIYFRPDRDIVEIKDRPIIKQMALILNDSPELRIKIVGHTSTNGSPTYLRQLALGRAQYIKSSLVELGVDSARIEIRGAGGDEPIASNKTAAGRARNNRCQFETTDK